MSDFVVVWGVDWTSRPLQAPACCHHDPAMVLPIDLRLERRKGRGSTIVMSAAICMDCGSDRTGQMGLAEGLSACMDAYGDRFQAWARLQRLADHRSGDFQAGEMAPLWLHLAISEDPGEVVARFNEAVASRSETAA